MSSADHSESASSAASSEKAPQPRKSPQKRKAPQNIMSTQRASDLPMGKRSALATTSAPIPVAIPAAASAPIPAPIPVAAPAPIPQSAAAVPQSAAATVCMNAAEKAMRCALQQSIAAAAKATAAAAVSARDTNAANALPESDRIKLPMSPELMEHLAYVAKNAAAQASTLFRRIAESIANAGSATSSQVMLGYVAAATINANSAVNQSKLAVAVSEIIRMALYMNK